MKKILISLLCVLLCTTCLLACGKKDKEEETIPNDEAIYGTWTESIWDSGYTFREDGSGLDIFWDQPFTYTAIEGDLVITYTEVLTEISSLNKSQRIVSSIKNIPLITNLHNQNIKDEVHRHRGEKRKSENSLRGYICL